jgi:ribonuclease HI
VDCINLNFDGVEMSNLGLVGVEGILKSEEGKILYAFYKFIGITTNNQAKVEVATKRIKLFLSNGFQNIKLHKD